MTIFELNYIVALGTVALQVGAILLLGVYFFRKNPFLSPVADFTGKWGLTVGFLLALTSTVMSLMYSEYYGVIPCGLCWLQRAFIYSQVVVFAVALFLKDLRAAWYSIWLSVCGGIVSLYQHFIQVGGHELVPCPASGAGDCAKRFIYEFDYITFPLVAFSVFAFLIVLMLFVRERERSLK